MGHGYSETGHLGDFSVVVSNPSGAIVRFTITDTQNRLQDDQIKAQILKDAIATWIAAERADLNTNGDTALLGETPYYPGDGYAGFSWNFEEGTASYTLRATTNLNLSQTITASVPWQVA